MRSTASPRHGPSIPIPACPPAGAAGAVASFDYAFDSIGNLVSRADNDTSYTERFCYDGLNRLTSYKLSTSTSCPLGGTGAKTVAYDALGNITAKSDVGSYAYPASGSPSVRPHAVSAITGTVNPNYHYDANGNLDCVHTGSYPAACSGGGAVRRIVILAPISGHGVSMVRGLPSAVPVHSTEPPLWGSCARTAAVRRHFSHPILRWRRRDARSGKIPIFLPPVSASKAETRACARRPALISRIAGLLQRRRDARDSENFPFVQLRTRNLLPDGVTCDVLAVPGAVLVMLSRGSRKLTFEGHPGDDLISKDECTVLTLMAAAQQRDADLRAYETMSGLTYLHGNPHHATRGSTPRRRWQG